jgi:hypothetical protein
MTQRTNVKDKAALAMPLREEQHPLLRYDGQSSLQTSKQRQAETLRGLKTHPYKTHSTMSSK